MRLLIGQILIFALFGVVLSVPSVVHADSKADYEYQYSQYRQNYLEYTLLKKDYLENPTLDNQQKAVLAAKETLKSRELAKANYASYLLLLIKEKNSGYSPIDPIIVSLESAKSFFLSEASKSLSLVTPADLKNFSESYFQNSLIHDRSFRTGVIGNKIAYLVRFQIDLKNGLDTTLPKLSTPFSTPLNARIEDLKILGNKINSNIDTFTNKLLSEEEMQNIDSENYFSDKSETLKSIQTQQLKWIDNLIDIDLNYVHS